MRKIKEETKNAGRRSEGRGLVTLRPAEKLNIRRSVSAGLRVTIVASAQKLSICILSALWISAKEVIGHRTPKARAA